MIKPTPTDEPLPADRAGEFASQLKDLKPLLERKDPALSKWELDFLTSLVDQKKRAVPSTIAQANKLNQIYEQKYLRGVYT